MLKVALTTLIVIHVVWWPIGFVLFQFHGWWLEVVFQSMS